MLPVYSTGSAPHLTDLNSYAILAFFLLKNHAPANIICLMPEKPYLIINAAMSADGKIDTFERNGASISSPEDKRRVLGCAPKWMP